MSTKDIRNESSSSSTNALRRGIVRAGRMDAVEIEEKPRNESSARWQPRAGAFIERETGGRHGRIRAEARRRRFIANAIVISSTVAVLAMAAVFNMLLSR
jgi:hypothetical protein